MYYLVALMIVHAGPPAGQFENHRWLMVDKASCEAKRDTLLNMWGVVGKPSGPTPNPYLTDAWCYQVEEFRKEFSAG